MKHMYGGDGTFEHGVFGNLAIPKSQIPSPKIHSPKFLLQLYCHQMSPNAYNMGQFRGVNVFFSRLRYSTRLVSLNRQNRKL
jgi:hypothetical protein